MNYDEIKQMFLMVKGKVNILREQKSELEGKLNKVIEEQKILDEVQVFFQRVAQETQQELKLKIENIVNLALDTVFPNEYAFNLVFDIKYSRTDVKLKFLSKKSNNEIDPLLASGGGVIDVTAFALRIAFYSLQKNNINNTIILDEPMKFLSRDLLDMAKEIIKKLSDKLNVQIIMVTHIPEFIEIADKIFKVKKENSISIICENT